MADLKAFAEQLVNLTVKEVNELAQILKDEYGMQPLQLQLLLPQRVAQRQPLRRKLRSM